MDLRDPSTTIRRFYLQRDADVSGVSGTGMVAEGVEFHNGLCVITWRSPWPSVVVYQNIDHLQAVHGHEGKTRVVWIDISEGT